MSQLKSRGLVISDEDKAVRYLESIGYYRLSAYMYPFLKVPKETHGGLPYVISSSSYICSSVMC